MSDSVAKLQLRAFVERILRMKEEAKAINDDIREIYAEAKGNGFGYGLVREDNVTRTLSARYYKDGSEILIDRGFNPAKDLHSPSNIKNRPRRLTPRECSRLMGYDNVGQSDFRIPVSDTQAYKQFGNSVVVPVFAAVAKLMKPVILKAKTTKQRKRPRKK